MEFKYKPEEVNGNEQVEQNTEFQENDELESALQHEGVLYKCVEKPLPSATGSEDPLGLEIGDIGQFYLFFNASGEPLSRVKIGNKSLNKYGKMIKGFDPRSVFPDCDLKAYRCRDFNRHLEKKLTIEEAQSCLKEAEEEIEHLIPAYEYELGEPEYYELRILRLAGGNRELANIQLKKLKKDKECVLYARKKLEHFQKEE